VDAGTGKGRFFGPLPERGPWTAVGLTRAQFAGILGLSILLFLLVDGPVWEHVRDRHFRRITISYAAIPLAVAWALARNGSLRPHLVLGASAVIALLKLVLTAGLLIALALMR
jgi:hypothetical protein